MSSITLESIAVRLGELETDASDIVVLGQHLTEELKKLREAVEAAQEEEETVPDPNELTQEEVTAWAETEAKLEIGYEGPEVATFEKLCKRFSDDLYTGPIDESFGKGCASAAADLQQFRLLEPEDGVVGPDTKAMMEGAFEDEWTVGAPFLAPWGGGSVAQEVLGPYHPELGMIPSAVLGQAEESRMSTFGGPHDYGDRIYGQAYLSTYDSPAEMLQKRQDLVEMGVLMTADEALAVRYGDKDRYVEKRGELFFEGDLSRWPKTYGLGKYTKAGGSALLNPESYYIAMRFRGGLGRYNANNPKILLWCKETNKAVVVMRTDFGPHQDTGRDVDISPGAADALYLEPDDDQNLPTDSKVYFTWAPDDAPLGPVAIEE